MTPSAGRFEHLHILIVDDNKFVRRITERICETLGVGRITIATDGYDAITQTAVADPPIDVIVCDLNMPGLDGIETLRHLASVAPGPGIVVASAIPPMVLRTVAELVRLRGLRLLGCIDKPLTVAILEPLLEDYIMHHAPPRRLAVAVREHDLKVALAERQLVPFFQPKVCLKDGHRLVGVEALARWDHPDHGTLPPSVFLPLAEEAGLMDALTDLVLERAVEAAGRWRTWGMNIDLAVNLNAPTLERTDLVERIVALTTAKRLPLEALVLEITENGFNADRANMLETVTRLGFRGVRLSIDDFGTGHSTMQRLIHLPFSELKIDRSFVSGAETDHRVRIVLESNLIMARRLDLKVVAEGVETPDQERIVRELGCDVAQGFLFGRPMPEAELLAWEEERARRRRAAAGERAGAGDRGEERGGG